MDAVTTRGTSPKQIARPLRSRLAQFVLTLSLISHSHLPAFSIIEQHPWIKKAETDNFDLAAWAKTLPAA